MENHSVDNKARNYEIDLKFFYTVFRKCWYWILITAILFGLIVGVYYSFFVKKSYSSTVNMYVDPNPGSSSTLNQTAADALAATYPPVIRHSDKFAQEVALSMAKLTKEDGSALFPQWTYETQNGTETPNGWGRVRGMLSTGIADSKIFYITIRSTDPKEAYEMANVAAEKAPEILNDIVGVGYVKVIGQPVLDSTPDSPNVARNAMLAALVGAVLVYAAFFLAQLFDNTVRFEGDLARFGLPMLGTIPSFPEEEGERPRKNDKGVKRA